MDNRKPIFDILKTLKSLYEMKFMVVTLKESKDIIPAIMVR